MVLDAGNLMVRTRRQPIAAGRAGGPATPYFTVEGVPVNCDALLPTSARISKDCDHGSSFGVFTLNLDHVVKLRRNAEFRAAYGAARYVTADGLPIVWAGRLTGVNVGRVTGADLIEPLCAAAAKSGQPVFLFGGRFDALAGAARHLVAQCPSLNIAGAFAPEADFDPTSEQAATYARMIAESGAKICFVALGAPKQEVFTSIAVKQTEGVAFVCIGAGLDFLAGTQTRAPRLMQTLGGEWLWRLLSNPGRMAKRYLDCLLVLPSVLLPSLTKQAQPADTR
jgi:N-acetylglucosaminyldiphosphoundecaprenol N-acetyl-beta-D-mannosaminyltransferase